MNERIVRAVVALGVLAIWGGALWLSQAAYAQVGPGGIALSPGWQLVSVPVVPGNTAPAAVLASISGHYEEAQALDGCATSPTLMFDPTASSGNTLTVIDQRIGLWIKMTSPGTLSVSGTPPTSTTLQLCRGLNLVGYPLAESLPVTSVLAPIAGKYSRVYGYDATNASDPWQIYDVAVPDFANTLQTMQPGRGYYILATENTTLVLAEAAAPSGSFSGLTDGATITEPTVISGTVNGTSLAAWRLDYRLQGDPTFTTFASGTTPVTNATLGTFDPTLLLNGLYEIRLVVTNATGQSEVSSVSGIVVEGQAKIGNFALTYPDLEVPLAGIPIQILRRYDSRDKRTGDFGVGWSLSLSDVRLQESGVLGADWVGTKEGGVFFSLCIRSNKPRTVTVTLSDGSIHKFQPVLTPACGPLAAPDEVTIGFQPLGDTKSSLSIRGDNTALVVGTFPGNVTLFDANFNPFDPSQYQLTLADGRQLDIDQVAGLQAIRDTHGNTLTFSSTGITHSTGKGVSFARDAQGRITQITDPAGNHRTYSYSAAGDLAQSTDQLGNVTSYGYNSTHGLLSIQDPLGRLAARSDYDASGRLIAITDSQGNRTSLTHDLAARQEVISDRLGNTTVLGYDARGNILQRTDALGRTTSFTYDANDNLLSTTDPLGHTTAFTYDAQDNLLTRTDPLGNTLRFTYNDLTLPLSATDALGRQATLTYSGFGDLLSVSDRQGNLVQYAYDSLGNRISMRDPLGNQTLYGYDTTGNRIRVTDALGVVTNRTFDDNNRLLTATTTRLVGGVTQAVVRRFAYDARGQQTELTDAEGGVTRIAYTATGRQASRTDARNQTTTFEYDSENRLVRTLFPDGLSETIAYDADGRQTATTDRAGRTTAYTYDRAGQLIQTTLPDGSTTRFSYDAAARKTSETDENNHTATFSYDAAGRKTSVTDPLGNTTTFTFDATGNLTSRINALGRTTAFTYDNAGRLLSTVFADGTSQTSTYDADGRRVSLTDQAGVTTRFAYDARGSLTRVTDALGQVTSFAYDELRNRISQTDALGNVTSFAYDREGRQIGKTLPMGQSETRVYDANGNPVSQQDFNGRTTSYAYDNLDRVTRRTLADGTTLDYTYTTTGQTATLLDASGVTTFSYDQRDRPVHLEYPGGGALNYTYDGAGNRVGVTTSAGTTTSAYDANDRLVAVTDSQGLRTTYSYDANGNRTSSAYPNGITTSYSYDVLDRLTTMAHRLSSNVVGSYTYTLGPVGNRTRVVEDTGRTVDYTYDALYRLTAETIAAPGVPAVTLGYGYDATGNRVSRSDAAGTTTSVFDANDRLMADGATNYAYDASGNALSRSQSGETTTFQYDALNRLVQSSAPGGTVTRFAYNGLDDRIQKVDASGTVNYLVDPFDPSGLAQVLRESDATGTATADYVYGSELLSMRSSAGYSVYVHDGQWSTRALTDAAGTITDTYVYDGYGNQINRRGTTPNNYMYNGQQFDPDLDGYYLRARYYTPASARFLSADPLEGALVRPQSLNRYTYAENDPINRADPSGATTTGSGTLAETEVATAGDAIVESSMSADDFPQVMQLMRVTQISAAATATATTSTVASTAAVVAVGAALALDECIDEIIAGRLLPSNDLFGPGGCAPPQVPTMAVVINSVVRSAGRVGRLDNTDVIEAEDPIAGVTVGEVKASIDLAAMWPTLTGVPGDAWQQLEPDVARYRPGGVSLPGAEVARRTFIRHSAGALTRPRGYNPAAGTRIGTAIVTVLNIWGSNLRY